MRGMGWPVKGSFVALRGFKATKSDSIDSIMSRNVSRLQVIVSCNLGCGGVETHHSPQIVRRISGVFAAIAGTSWSLG